MISKQKSRLLGKRLSESGGEGAAGLDSGVYLGLGGKGGCCFRFLTGPWVGRAPFAP